MILPNTHSALVVDGILYDMSHLDTFGLTVPGKGREPGSDLQVLVRFSNHVVTERARRGQAHNTVDHHGKKRIFDPARYDMSLHLADIIRQGFVRNALCFVSKDFSGHQNLIMTKRGGGKTWSIVFCFQPLKYSVMMEVLSMHPKSENSKSKRNQIIYFARTCLFQQKRIPKTKGPTEAGP